MPSRDRTRLSVIQGGASRPAPAPAAAAPAIPTSDLMLLAAEAEVRRMETAEGSLAATDKLIVAAFRVSAVTAIGRAAKVRMLVRRHAPELRGDLGPGGELLRAILAEYAGMTPADFAAL